MATLTGSTIASSYEQLLSLPDGGGDASTPSNLVAVTDGDAGTTFAMQLSTTTICIDNATTSSASQGGILRLQSDDGAVMASGHRLGVIEFGGAEDTSNTITTGARIEALADATWSASENGADMIFYTTDGNASQSEVMRLTADAGTEFTGNVTLSSDASVLNFGAGDDVTFTHDNGTGMNVASAGDFDIAVSAGDATFTVADTKTLILGQTGASELKLSPNNTAGSELASLINTAGTTDGSDAAGAILLSSVAGGIGLAWADGKDLWAEGGRAVITANEDAASCIKLHADDGTSQTILIQNDAGTGVSAATEVDAAIQLSASAGGIGLYSALNAANAIRLETNSGTSETLILHSNQGTAATSINLLSDAGGITLDSTALTVTGPASTFASSTSAKPLVIIKNTTNDTTAPTLRFVMDKGAAGADGDDCGTIEFYGDDDNQDNIAFATILAEVADASEGDECGKLSLKVAENDGTNTAGLELIGSTTDTEVDVNIGSGAASVTAIAGDLSVNNANINLGALKKLYFDGGGDTYFLEAAANKMRLFCAATQIIQYQTPKVEVNTHLLPEGNKVNDLGQGGQAWNSCYADDFENEGDFYHFDEYDDLAVINGIKGSGERQAHNGYELIDDSTLPDWLVAKHKRPLEASDAVYYTDEDEETKTMPEGKNVGDLKYAAREAKKIGDKEISDDGNPYLSLKTMISLLMGAVRQLDAKIEAL